MFLLSHIFFLLYIVLPNLELTMENKLGLQHRDHRIDHIFMISFHSLANVNTIALAWSEYSVQKLLSSSLPRVRDGKPTQGM